MPDQQCAGGRGHARQARRQRIDIQGGTPERFGAYIKAEVAKWAR